MLFESMHIFIVFGELEYNNTFIIFWVGLKYNNTFIIADLTETWSEVNISYLKPSSLSETALPQWRPTYLTRDLSGMLVSNRSLTRQIGLQSGMLVWWGMLVSYGSPIRHVVSNGPRKFIPDKTGRMILLNSSKQPQEPDWANPLKIRPSPL